MWIRKRSSLKSLGARCAVLCCAVLRWAGLGWAAVCCRLPALGQTLHSALPRTNPALLLLACSCRQPCTLHLVALAGDASSSATKRNWLLVRHYWHRVGGCALNWFVW